MLLSRSRRLLSSSYIQVFSANALLQLLGFGSVLLVAKFLAPQQLALVKTAQAYAAVLVVLAGLGLTTPLMFYCADPAHSEDNKRALLRLSIRWILLMGAALIATAWATVAVLPQTAAATHVYRLYALALPGLALTSLLFVYLQARQQFAFLARSQATIKSVSVLAVVVATYRWGIDGFLYATLLSLYIGLIPIVRHVLPGGWTGAPAVVPAGFVGRAAYGMVGSFVTMVGQSSDFMLMDACGVDRLEVGRYALASTFLLAAITLTGSIQSVVTPKFTALQETPETFLAYLRGWNRRMPLISLTVALLGISSAWLLEHWFFGAQYAGFTTYLAILMLKYALWSNYAIIGAALLGAGIVRSGVVVALLSMLLSFAIGWPLGQQYGGVGIAWTQVIVAGIVFLSILVVKRIEFGRRWPGVTGGA